MAIGGSLCGLWNHVPHREPQPTAANPQELAETMDEALLMRERERRERHKYCLGCVHAMRLCV